MTSRMFLRFFYPNVKRCPVKISSVLNRPYVECSKRKFTTTKLALDKDKVSVTFVFHSGERVTTSGAVGDTLLDVVVNNNVNLDGYGACEGTLTCSTCHVILKQQDYDRLPEQPVDEEKDMLDLAYGLTDTSRLGCQIVLTKELEGLEVQVPETINDIRS